jgi:hypothetical protein
MKYSTYIDNKTAIEWGLSIQQAVLFDWLYTLPSWAEAITIKNGRFYFASKNLACRELPLLTNKPDTIYRYYKQLKELGLIEIEKVSGKDYIHLTKKSAVWGRESTSEHSDSNPSKVGFKSETSTDSNPTYKYTIEEKNTRDKKGFDLFPTDSKKEDPAKELFLPYNSQAFRIAWGAWRRFLKTEKKKDYKTLEAEQFVLIKLSKMAASEAEAIEIIEKSRSSNWMGFFPLKHKKNDTTNDRLSEEQQQYLVNRTDL